MMGKIAPVKFSVPDMKVAVAEILAGWNRSVLSHEFESCQPLTLLNRLVDDDNWSSLGVHM
jgi:hypothetical protein